MTPTGALTSASSSLVRRLVSRDAVPAAILMGSTLSLRRLGFLVRPSIFPAEVVVTCSPSSQQQWHNASAWRLLSHHAEPAEGHSCGSACQAAAQVH